jgi:hypothetical protein
MKAFLKTVLAIGLVASSSLALAEGKYAFRQPLQGVDGQQYYGMSQSQVDDAIAEQERLAQIEADKAMCLNESTWTEEVTKYETVTTTESVYGTKGPYRNSWNNISYDSSGEYNTIVYVKWGGTGQHNFATYVGNLPFPNGYTIQDGSTTYTASSCDATGCAVTKTGYHLEETTHQEPYTEIVTVKTDNYDYCVNKGYETA